MVASQNGYSANDRTKVKSYVVTKTGRTMTLRAGPPGEMLADCVRWFDENIRDIDPGIMDDWSYAERDIRGSTQVSNHASGTAADVDATKWPLGSDPEKYLSKPEIAKLKQHLLVYEGCIRWGGDYTGRKDPMHFEVNRDEATVTRVWNKLKSNGSTTDTEELTVAQYDNLVALIKQNHADMAGAVWAARDAGVAAEKKAEEVRRILVGGHTDGNDRLTDLWNREGDILDAVNGDDATS